ncbi:MAG TPA: ABC transporter permease [Bacteroidota bacterium]|nr:ABC transporter permease [Bacteroidota bacterium]
MNTFLRSLKQSTTWKIAIRETERLSTRRTLLLLMTVLPIALSFLLAFIYKNEVVTDIPMAVVDQDRSELSRLLTRSVDATRSMKVVMSLSSVGEIREQMRKGTILGALYIPDGLERELKKGKQAHVVIYKGSFNLIIGNSILKDATTIVKTVSAGVLMNKFRKAGMTEDQALALANPIRLDSNNLFNPNYNYESYFVPCLIAAMFQMLILVTSVLLISSEHHDGTLRSLLDLADGNTAAILIGKSLPHLAIHAATTLFILGIIFPLFGIPVHGSLLLLLGYVLFANAAVFFLGFLISSLVHNQLFATEIAVFITTPAVLFSGYTFPIEAMPVPHGIFAQLLPFTSFFAGFIKIYEMGDSVWMLGPEIAVTSCILAVSVAGSLFVLRRVASHASHALPEGGIDEATI